MKKLPERKKNVLCTNIDAIKAKALELMGSTKMFSQSRSNAEEIYILSKLVKKQALAMEKRLYLYKETIEGLGFKRVRKARK